MRIACFVVLSILFGGCDRDTATTCVSDCSPCDGGVCFASGGQLQAVCLRTCSSTADCPTGLECRKLDYIGNDLPPFGSPSVCASDTLPAPCAPVDAGFWCEPSPPQCIDDQRLGTFFLSPGNSTCGFTVSICPNGCEQAIDGGMSSGRCR